MKLTSDDNSDSGDEHRIYLSPLIRDVNLEYTGLLLTVKLNPHGKVPCHGTYTVDAGLQRSWMDPAKSSFLVLLCIQVFFLIHSGRPPVLKYVFSAFF